MRWLPRGIGPLCICACAALSPSGEGGVPAATSHVGQPQDSRPLNQIIDQLLDSANGIVRGRPASDAEYLRRLSLDLVGMPPTADEVRAFLQDSSADKRARAIDRRLNDPRFARHWTSVLNVMLLERRTSSYVSQEEWEGYLLRSLQQNRPLHELIFEILSSDGTDAETRPSVQFYLAREGAPHLITRDVGRIFFGRDLECAQCHDHPLVDDYLQRDYHAMLAVFQSGSVITRKENDKDVGYYGEQPGKDDVYESVFVSGKHVTGPRLPGEATIDEPLLLPGADREARTEHAEIPKPVASRREMFAKAATDGTNVAFNENLANRLWAQMMGRGLVHPADFTHPRNPPTHPELLQILGERLAAMQFNLREFLRELALTRAYRRSIDPPQIESDVLTGVQQRHALLLAQIEQDQVATEALQDAYKSTLPSFVEAESNLLPAVEDFDTKRTAMATAVQKHSEAVANAEEVSRKLAAQTVALEAVREAGDKTATAVEKIPGDEELAAAAKVFQQRVETLTAEVDTLQKSHQEKTAAAEQATAEMTTASEAAQAAAASLVPLKESLRSAEQAVVKAREDLLNHSTRQQSYKQDQDQLQRLVAWSEATAGLEEADATIVERERLVARAQSEWAASEQTLRGLIASAAEMNAALEPRRAEMQQIEEQVAAVSNHTEKLAEALSKINEVRSTLEATDGSLDTAAAELETKIRQLQTEQGARESARQQAQAAIDAELEKLTAHQQQVAQAEATLVALQTTLQDATASLEAAREEAATVLAQRDQEWEAFVDSCCRDGIVRPLQHLSPEQMCWSMLQVTGVYERTWQHESAELEKEAPLDKYARMSPVRWLERGRAIEQRTYDKLKGNVGTFVQIYGAGAGQGQVDFFASAEQALFLANGSAVNSWTAPAASNVTDRMVQSTEAQSTASELYLSVLSRPPTEDEIAMVADYMQGHPADQRGSAASALVWGLLTSTEFRFNH